MKNVFVKKLCIKNLLLLVLFSASLSFAAEEDEITTMPMQAGPALEVEEKEEREVKEAKAEKKSGVSKAEEPVGKRPKKKGYSKNLEYLFKRKGVPAAVVQHTIGSFLPEGYVVPLDWNVKFEKGEKVKIFAEHQIGTATTTSLRVSPEGRYVAFGFYHIQSHQGGILVWDMQSGSGKPQEILIDRNFNVVDIEFGSRGRLAYVAYESGSKNEIVGMVDLPNLAQYEGELRGVEKWQEIVLSRGAKLCLSNDSNYLKIITGPDKGIIRDFATGNLLLQGQLPQGTAFSHDCELPYELAAYSFDRTILALKQRFKNDIFFQRKDDSGQWDTYDTAIHIPQNGPRGNVKGIGLSPEGLRLCVVQRESSSYEVHIYDVMNGSKVTIDEIVGVSQLTPFGDENMKILGVSFSPDGHQLLLGIYDIRQKKIIIKIYDLEELVDYADMPPLEDAPDDE